MRARLIWRWLVSVILALIIVESSTALICWFLLSSSQAGRLLWKPDLELAESNWKAHFSAADEEIGGLVGSGAKANSEFPDHTKSCGSAYGDSFVGGADVANDEGWVEQLSHSL